MEIAHLGLGGAIMKRRWFRLVAFTLVVIVPVVLSPFARGEGPEVVDDARLPAA